MGLLTEEIRTFVNRQRLGFIATVNPDGTPNLSPKGTTIAWDSEHLAFADIHSPNTVVNLVDNPSIEINIVDVFARKGYRFKGVAEILSNGNLFEDIVFFYKNRGATYPIKNIVLVKVQSMSPLWSPIYDTGISEDEVRRKWTKYWNDNDGI